MKLVRFAINNFRGITGGLEQNSINFENSNAIFIFGQNNVGKSTFLHGYEAFYGDAVRSDDFTSGSENDILVEVWLKIEEDKDKPIIDVGTGNKFDNLKNKYLTEDSILKLRKTWKFSDKGHAPFNETYNLQQNSWEENSYGGIGLHGAFQPLIMRPLFIEAMPTEDEVENIVNEILKEAATKSLSNTESDELKEAAEVISRLQDKAYSKAAIDDYKRKVNERFNALFQNYEVSIDDGTSKVKYTHDKLGKDFKIGFKKIADGQPNSYMQMGHGAVRMAIFLLMLMRDELREEGIAQKDFLVLFEEPELFLHPTLTKKLRNLIYEVSGDDMPFQIICASHSPQMIDISKDHTSLVRMIKDEDDGSTSLFQVAKSDLTNTQEVTDEQVKQKIYEILRFDPFVCESFYADEVVLVEGDTEAIIWRGYQQSLDCNSKDIFVVNCHSCTNIPFYQKIFSNFRIPYSVICDTDHIGGEVSSETNLTGWNNKTVSPTFASGIQKSIADQYYQDNEQGKAKHFLVFPDTFEPCHSQVSPPFTYDDDGSEGKPFKADRYWKKIYENRETGGFIDIPIIAYIRKIVGLV